MYIVIFTSLLALLFTHLESKYKMRNGMLIGFILITTLGVIHYDYGNDYMAYYDLFKKFNNYPFNLEKILNKDFFDDSGWVILCYFFGIFGGFFMMVAVLNVIQNIIVYRFIKKNIEKQWWVMAMFIYLFATNLYLMNFSMMRQGFVVCVFLGMWKYIRQRKWWWPLLILYLCSYIHASAIILLPFAFWGYLPVKNGKILTIIYIALYVIFWAKREFINEIYYLIAGSSESLENYSITYENRTNTATYSIGFIFNLVPFILSLYYIYNSKDCYKKKIVLLATANFLIVPFTQITPLIGRLGTYFAIYKLAAIPIVLGFIQKKEIKMVCIALYILMTVYDYWLFFNVGVFVVKHRVFHTIFEVL